MKFLLSIMLLFCPVGVTYPVSTPMSVITNYAYMYKSSSFDSEKIVDNQNNIVKIEHGESVTLLDENITNNFYYVSYKTFDGFVHKEYLAVLDDEQPLVLTYNAKTAVKTTVYQLGEDGTYTPNEDIVLDDSTELYLYEGFNRKAEFNAVKFSYNGKIMLGYIKTEDISPYGVSSILIISITAIIACTSVILILLGISKKKSKITPLLKKFEKKEID